jgi:uncharacterized membrane protein YidH (DUF202 family)
MKSIYKKTIVIAVFVFMASTMVVLPAMAQADNARNVLGFGYAEQLGLESTNADPRDTAVDIVRYLMTFLGIIAVIVILIGGFRWMTAAGNEDRVASAKKTIIAGAIGLVVILAAFAIVTFVIDVTADAINGDIN